MLIYGVLLSKGHYIYNSFFLGKLKILLRWVKKRKPLIGVI